MSVVESGTPSENSDPVDKPEIKLKWHKPELEILEFRNTEGGVGAFGEGTFAGLPVGSLTS